MSAGIESRDFGPDAELLAANAGRWRADYRVRRRGVCSCASRIALPPIHPVAIEQSFTTSREQIAAQLAAHGLKPTEQRVRIASVLLDAPKHLTAEQILAAVRAKGERVSKATVYNTLKAFAHHGLVRQIHVDAERTVYDSMRAPHHHFHDVETGELRDIRPEEIVFARLPELPPGMEAESVEVVIRLRKKRS